ncbi:MAG: hypothetical protein ACTSV2_14905 [Candidatus Thorarchaeota archaeon]
MKVKTPLLVKNELRMLYNQVVVAIKTPSLLVFYCITIIGAFVISSIFSMLVNLAPFFTALPPTLEYMVPRNTIFLAVGVLTLSSILSGYFGNGPTETLELADEYILMPSPLHPHQILVSRYTRKIIRKVSFTLIGVLILLPLISLNPEIFASMILFLVALIVFLEINSFLGAIANVLKEKIVHQTGDRKRHILIIIIALAIYLPTLPLFTQYAPFLILMPSNIFSLLLMEMTGIHAIGLPIVVLVTLLLNGFIISLLFLLNIVDYTYYEQFTTAHSSVPTENTFSTKIRGLVDFSKSKFNDPIIWIILKDYWSKMRSPLQFYKYLYVVIGIVFTVYLNVFRPTWLQQLTIPPSLSYAIILAFLLILILMTQLSSVSSLLAFVDEKENIYLLKASPFREQDIVLAKYIFSLIEVSLTALPMYGFMIYLLNFDGVLFLITLGGPLIAIFCATGIMAGAFVPVFTNDPRNAPVPVAFSFPAINLGLGALIVWMTATYSHDLTLLWLLPLTTIAVVMVFLSLSVRALKMYR